jgi:hypothetical protein
VEDAWSSEGRLTDRPLACSFTAVPFRAAGMARWLRPQAAEGCCNSLTRKAATMSLTPRMIAKAATQATRRTALRP